MTNSRTGRPDLDYQPSDRGSCQNLADAFNLTGVTNRVEGGTEIWDTWIIGAPLFGRNTPSTIWVAEVADLNQNGIHDDAPDVVPDVNHDGICARDRHRRAGIGFGDCGQEFLHPVGFCRILRVAAGTGRPSASGGRADGRTFFSQLRALRIVRGPLVVTTRTGAPPLPRVEWIRSFIEPWIVTVKGMATS